MFVIIIMKSFNSHIKNLLVILFCLFLSINDNYAQNDDIQIKKDSITKSDQKPLRYYQRFGPPYYPDINLTDKDSLEWPLEFEIALTFKDIKDLDVKNNSFIADYIFEIYSDYDLEYTTENGEVLEYFHHPDWIQAFLKITEETQIDGPYYSFRSVPSKVSEQMLEDLIAAERITPGDFENYLTNDEISFYDKKFSKSSVAIVNEFDHNWDLSDYPFDTQKLLFEFQTTYDTSVVVLNPSTKFISSFEKKMRNLTAGYQIRDVTYRSEYKSVPSDVIRITPTLARPQVTQSLIVELNVERNGLVLFFKIFTGGILSYFISCMVFLIPLKELESRINLAVGGIFGAIGSSAFVYEVLPVVNVFNKADAINNLIIGMVVFNILILLLQQGTFKRVNVDGKYMYQNVEVKYFKRLQDSEFAFFYSIFAFFVILLAILLW